VRGVHFERWFATGGVLPAAAWGAIEQDAALAGVADALWSLARFTGADRVSLGRVVPGRLRPPLARALRVARPAPGPAPEPPPDQPPESRREASARRDPSSGIPGPSSATSASTP
jgi:hypothetical protein